MIETRTVHEQLIQRCQQQLASGRWAPGDRFPSERELSLEHGLSRATANKVLAKLVSEGWLEMKKGIGCFVTERPTLFASLRKIESFTDFTREQGYTPGTQVLEFRPGAVVADAIRDRLEATRSQSITFVRRLRLLDGKPVIYEERWLPAALYPRLKSSDLEGSFYHLCNVRYHMTIQKEEAEIQAVMPPSFPEIQWNSPALRLEGTGHDAASKVLWYQVLYYHGAHFVLRNSTDLAHSQPILRLQFA